MAASETTEVATRNNGNVQQKKPAFSEMINTKTYQRLIMNTLGDPDTAKRFTSSVISAVAVNPAIQECDMGSILACAFLGESLKLSPSPQLGHFYMVPFKQKAKYDKDGKMISPAKTVAQFIPGYKGYVQLALRSGQYKKMNVIELKAGEIQSFDPLNEDLKAIIINDYAAREAAPTVGYYVMFEYLNGFRKAMYWTKERMMSYADRYSPAFSAAAMKKIEAGEVKQEDMWKYSSFWYKDFDEMAKKTMLRQIITHWGIMSREMQKVVINDSAVVELGNNGEIITTEEQNIEIVQPEYFDVDTRVNLEDL